MSIETWTEAQLAQFIQNEVSKQTRSFELPRFPAAVPNALEPKNDDLLIFQGDRWIPYTMPAVRVWRSTSQTLGISAPVAIVWDTERFDTEKQAPGMWNPGANTSRLTAYQAGVYLVIGRVRFSGTAAGLRLQLFKTDAKGTQTKVDEEFALDASGATDEWAEVVTLVQLASGEYMELFAGHDALANIDVESESDVTPTFMMTRIA